MRLNIFRIPQAELPSLRDKLSTSGLAVIKEVELSGWVGEFYFSTEPSPSDIPWVKTFSGFFEGAAPQNKNYFAAFLLTNGSDTFALSYGKAHFYIRPFCDYDFGIELAKRIADENDIRQTAARRFQGKQKKQIKSYSANTSLNIESGESVDYLQSAIIDSKRESYGPSGKFGTSALVSPEIDVEGIGDFLSLLRDEMSTDALFKLPRTVIISEELEVVRLDTLLAKELLSPSEATDFTHNTYDLFGVDFVFGNTASYTIKCGRKEPMVIEGELSIGALKQYISEQGLSEKDVLRIRIVWSQEDGPTYSKDLRHSLDFIVDDERIVLENGRWMRFNQDYLDFLDDFVSNITVEEVEPEFHDISLGEPEFNTSAAITDAGYGTADKDFSIFRTKSSTPIEAWDLSRDTTVYAVKFGTAQKLSYVCDQAIAVLELMRNRAQVKKIPNFQRYCLWLGYKGKRRLENISQSGSIILKQKIELWARRSRELGIEPVIKVSRRT
jgi:uncharacterized protein (TIGR04141 family)